MDHLMISLERTAGPAPTVPYWQNQRLAVQAHYHNMLVGEDGQPTDATLIEVGGIEQRLLGVPQAVVWWDDSDTVRDVSVQLTRTEGNWSPQVLRELLAREWVQEATLTVEGGSYRVRPLSLSVGLVTVCAG